MDIVADAFDLRAAVMAVAVLSIVSGLVVAARMDETVRSPGYGQPDGDLLLIT